MARRSEGSGTSIDLERERDEISESPSLAFQVQSMYVIFTDGGREEEELASSRGSRDWW